MLISQDTASAARIGSAASGGESVGTTTGVRVGRWSVVLFALLALIGPTQTRSQDGGAAPLLDPANIESAFSHVVRTVSPGVVSIRVQRSALAPATAADAAGHSAATMVVVNGAGTIISDGGAILTNEHVIRSAQRIDVTFHDGVTQTARVTATDVRADLAILHTSRRDLPAVRFCDWAGVARGQWAIAIGNPFGLGGDGRSCVSIGVVANLGRRLPGLGEADDRLYHDMIQTTASVNPGNSGGPLFNLRGELIGVVTAMHTRSAADQGVGFAIPMSPQRLQRVEQLLRSETPAYGFLGLTTRDAAVDAGEAANGGGGALVETLEPGGPAEQAGLREGDRIVRMDDDEIRGAADLAVRIGEATIGSAVVLTVQRGRRLIETPVVVVRRDVERVESLRGGAIGWRGLRVAAARAVDAGGIVVIEVSPGSPAERVGLRVGDRIERVQGAVVEGVAAFREAVRQSEGAVELRLADRRRVRIDPP
ncbi:MAG: trypsin-like peptidase domain-containing protein [Phycisphaerales bacterium]|nr:trypsin-like peptidase domain-containing protein [Phycisphaerales bacterium]